MPEPEEKSSATPSEKKLIIIQPLEKIALTFSGGGYRAAAYALGVLSYFERIPFKGKPLLQNVKAISTVSGGTITGAVYAANRENNFKDFYQGLYVFLSEDKLLDHALKKLEDVDHWRNNHKKRSLINAFAESYYELLVKKTFADLEGHPHLEDITFNATEFNNAKAFRFQTTGQFGNGFTHCKELNAVKDSILIADAIAASSCFPMGFEPIVFPNDFIKPDTPGYKDLKNCDQFKTGLGLMDGGIVDNQGIESIVRANDRVGKFFDFIMISDVGGPTMEPWKPEEKEDISGFRAHTPATLIGKTLQLKKWLLLPALLFVAGIVLSIAAFTLKMDKNALWFGGIMLGSVLVFAIIGLLLRQLVQGIEKSVSDFVTKHVPVFASSRLKNFDDLEIGLFERMIKERASSAIAMTSDVFMKQVRRFAYHQVYANENWMYRRSSNLIYELAKKESAPKEKALDQEFEQEVKPGEKARKVTNAELDDPGEKLQNAASIAATMGTTLWFEESDRNIKRLENLIACGQFTTCYNLLRYLDELKKDESPYKSMFNNPNDELPRLYDWLMDEWKAFKKEPLRIVYLD